MVTKLERFINKYKLQMEIVLNPGQITVYIGEWVDIKLYSYSSESLEDAIDKAITDYSRRFLK